MITLKRLTWDNLFSYAGGNTIDLNATSITQLLGKNGHGKSSIPLVLQEVLFNKNSKGIKKADILNRNLDTNKYSASCEFAIDGAEYVLNVSRTGATQKVTLTKDGKDISSHTASATFDQVEQLLGLDFKTFSQLVYQNSGSSLQFLTATDANRKKFLIDLLSLERYVTISEAIKVAYKSVNESLIKLRSRQDTIKSWLDNAARDELVERSLVEVPEIDSTKPNQLERLKSKLSEVETINAKVDKNNTLKAKIPSTKPTQIQETKQDTRLLLDVKATITHDKKAHLATIKKYSGITSSRCPTCFQSVDTDSIKEITSTAQSEIRHLDARLKEIESEVAKMEAVNSAISAREKQIAEFERLSSMVDNTLPTMKLARDDIESEIKQLNSYITSINNAIKVAQATNIEVIAHNAKVQSVRERLDSYKEDLDKVELELKVVTSKLSTLETLKKAFSNTGLIAYKIENSVKELEALTNTYLAELSGGRFQLAFELSNDKLNVVIVDNGKEIDISALSAGELTRVTTATLLAIRRLMAFLSKSKINVLFLDETIDSLDLDGRERLIEVLLHEEDLNTFIISHSYSHPLVDKLEVIKTKDISRIEK